MQILKLILQVNKHKKRPYCQVETPEITNLNASSLMAAMVLN